MSKSEYTAGVIDGIPVGIGYFSVSFGFGSLAVSYGLSVLNATLISITNLTSAGQFAGLTVITAAGSILELLLTQIIINSRYALMSLALGQRLGDKAGFFQRLIISFSNTDEIFGIAMARTQPLTTRYMLGLALAPIIGWSCGTLVGALASSVLPLSVRTALGVALYGMFVAIVLPQARKSRPLLIVCLMSLIFSCIFKWAPVLRDISSGLGIVICTVAAAGIAAFIFPVSEDSDNTDTSESGISNTLSGKDDLT